MENILKNIQWIFSGIGTELLILATGMIVSGLTGYKIGVRRSGMQNQKAKSNSKQHQELMIDEEPQGRKKGASHNKIRQSQKAGKNSTQIQIGRLHDGE